MNQAEKLRPVSVVLDFGPPPFKAVQRAQSYWDRLNAAAKAATTPAEKQKAYEAIWRAATRQGDPENWPFPDSGYDPANDKTPPPAPCAPGSWDAPAPAPAPAREWRQDVPPQDKPDAPAARSEWVSAPVETEWVSGPIEKKLKW